MNSAFYFQLALPILWQGHCERSEAISAVRKKQPPTTPFSPLIHQGVSFLLTPEACFGGHCEAIFNRRGNLKRHSCERSEAISTVHKKQPPTTPVSPANLFGRVSFLFSLRACSQLLQPHHFGGRLTPYTFALSYPSHFSPLLHLSFLTCSGIRLFLNLKSVVISSIIHTAGP